MKKKRGDDSDVDTKTLPRTPFLPPSIFSNAPFVRYHAISMHDTSLLLWEAFPVKNTRSNLVSIQYIFRHILFTRFTTFFTRI